MHTEDYTKVYLFEKYEDEKNVVLTCPLCVLDLEYEKAKETLFFAFQEDIIDNDEFKCLVVELKNLYFDRKYSKCAETTEEDKVMDLESMKKKTECLKNLVNEIEKCNAFVLEPHVGVFNRSDRFYEVIDMIWSAVEKNIISKKLGYKLEDMLIVP